MGLESSPTYLEDLNSAWPLSGDVRSEGDDHIRNLKSILLATFPNAQDGAINPSVAEFNKLVGLTASTAELNVLDGVTASTADINNAISDITGENLGDLADVSISGLSTGHRLHWTGAIWSNDKVYHGSMKVNGGQTLSTATTGPQQFTGNWTVGVEYGTDVDTANDEIVIKRAGTYLVQFAGVLTVYPGSGDDARFISLTLEQKVGSTFAIGNPVTIYGKASGFTQTWPIFISGMHTFALNDVVELWYNPNATWTTDPVLVGNGQMIVQEIL